MYLKLDSDGVWLVQQTEPKGTVSCNQIAVNQADTKEVG